MLKKEDVASIKQLLSTTELTYRDIAGQFNCSPSTVSNINSGKSYQEPNMDYPLRAVRAILSDNDKAFCVKLFNEGYTIKQIHIIIGKASYTTIHSAITSTAKYKADAVLEKRLEIFNIITTPSHVFINTLDYDLTIHDFVYIKYLSRMNVPLDKVIELYLPLINYPTQFNNHPIKTVDDVKCYIEWGGTKNRIIYWILQLYYNKVNCYNKLDFYYNDININRFLKINQKLDLKIVKEMIEFDTKENFLKRRT